MTQDTGPIVETLVLAALGDVLDPELGLDIVSLGLVYDIDSTAEGVDVTYTLTSPGCPLGEQIAADIVAAAGAVPGADPVRPHLVFSPRWSPEMVEEDARFALGY
jgi:metal-sulfur cluster biosynthetic enzyme